MEGFQKRLLVEAVRKNIELKGNVSWRVELLEKAPPILWFGDTRDSLPKIITIGANPSREEFLEQNKKEAQECIKNSKNLKYLKKSRFRTLTQSESLSNIISNESLQEEIIESFNTYFSEKSNPYTNWFGKPNGFNVEAFLNGLNASYYPNSNQYLYNAIHVDLFPFSTISDYKEISELADKDLFDNRWSQNFLENLLRAFNPSIKLIVVFGRTNFNKLKNLFPNSIKTKNGRKYFPKYAKGKLIPCTYWIGTFNSYNLVGLSINLGNPRGFTTKDLNNLGAYILTQIKLQNTID